MWNFNPPAAPHFGGIWELAVKSAKYYIKRTIRYHILTFVDYCTLLSKVEACLNFRPLQPLSDDASDFNPLTPSHFSIQRDSFLVPEPDSSTSRLTLGKRWKMVSIGFAILPEMVCRVHHVSPTPT